MSDPLSVSSRRVLVWFSAGAASAVAAKLALRQVALRDGEAIIAYADPGSEHPDNARFVADCERWLGRPVIRRSSEQYQDTWQVWTERRYLNGPAGENNKRRNERLDALEARCGSSESSKGVEYAGTFVPGKVYSRGVSYETLKLLRRQVEDICQKLQNAGVLPADQK